MKKSMEGQKPAVKAEPMPRAIEDCFRDIAKGRAAITALCDALESHIYDRPCKKKGRQYGIYQSLGDVDRQVLDEMIPALAGVRHAIRVTTGRLYVYGEKCAPSSPADRADKRFMDWFEKFAPAADAAIEMREEVEEANYGERSTQLDVLTPEDLAALSAEMLDIAVANLEDLATQVNEAQHVIEGLQQERTEAAQQVAEATGG
jgi:hypothetical protein